MLTIEKCAKDTNYFHNDNCSTETADMEKLPHQIESGSDKSTDEK